MSFLRNLADKVKRAAGVVPPYEVMETTAQQFAKFVALLSTVLICLMWIVCSMPPIYLIIAVDLLQLNI